MEHTQPQEIEISKEEMGFQLEKLAESLSITGIELTEKVKQAFDIYTRELLKWNTVINLTAITELSEVMTKHFYDSIAPLNELEIPNGATFIDIGTGAGFPGLPIKLLRPDIKLTLFDSLKKRVDFLKNTCEALQLKDITFIHARAEDAAKLKQYREKYDFTAARAVASLNVLCEYCLPFVKKGGIFIAYKGQKGTNELKQAENAIKLLGGEAFRTIDYKLPDEEGERQIILIKKILQTSPEYPRKTQIISKNPL